jgi:tripartite-type tricarboxylate transporter receptor subunit TctC
MSSWYFIAAPKGTPPSVVQKLNEALNDALADGELRKRAAAIGIELETKTSPASLQSLVQAEIERWRAAAANIRQEGK